MTRKEFYAYVETFRQPDGTFDKDDIYTIGVTFKTKLFKQDRKWQELVDKIGWNGSSESLRAFVNHRMQTSGVLPKDIMRISYDGIIGSGVSEETLNSMTIELAKERQKIRDERTAFNRDIKAISREEVFVEAIRDTVSQLKELEPLEYVPVHTDQKSHEAVLLLSDLHIGVKCDNWYNTYNTEIAKIRLQMLVESVISTCKLYNVQVLNVCNLGDMVHGIIHTNARVEAELNVVDQVLKAAELISEVLNLLQEAAPKIVYRSVIDNHSRVIANKEEALDSEHFSKLIDMFLMERLGHTSIVFANDNVDDGVGKFTLMNGKKIMFSHGHNDSINKVYQNFTGMMKEYIDYIFLGHYHSPKAKSFQDTMVFVNGSIVGTEQYAFNKRLFSSPSQTLLVFDTEVGKNSLINQTIDLSTGKGK